MAPDDVNAEETIKQEVSAILDLGKSLEDTQAELMQNEAFRTFIEMQKEFNEKSSVVWKGIEAKMITNGIKSIKGDWGTLTIVEKPSYAIPDVKLLPKKFTKTVPDTTKIGQFDKLENKLPQGVIKSITMYLMRRLK